MGDAADGNEKRDAYLRAAWSGASEMSSGGDERRLAVALATDGARRNFHTRRPWICNAELLAGASGAPLTVDDGETEEGVVNERPDARALSGVRWRHAARRSDCNALSADTRGASPYGVSVDEYTRSSNDRDRRKNHRRHRLINGVSGAGDRLVSRRRDANWRPLPSLLRLRRRRGGQSAAYDTPPQTRCRHLRARATHATHGLSESRLELIAAAESSQRPRDRNKSAPTTVVGLESCAMKVPSGGFNRAPIDR
uniref:Uncharacterized protein n=1 Tax=Plectus sambesii TaxID=2011161 RepID=A0A914URG8_9BILA